MPNTETVSLLKKKLQALWKDSRSFAQRLALAALAMGAACFTLIFFGPFEAVAFGGNSMSYSYLDIWWILALAALAVWVAGTLLLSLLKGKLFNNFVSLVFAVTLSSYVQAVFMNSSLGTLTGDAINWSEKTGAMALNLLAWAAIIGGVYFVLFLNKGIWKKIVTYGAILLLVMQSASTVSVFLGGSGVSAQKYCFTESGMYEYSSEDNIFVFVLDRMDYSSTVQEILYEDPDFFSPLDGFTQYTNAVSAYARTQPALNHLLTGSESAFTCSSKDFYADSWEEDGKHILVDLTQQDYSIEMYSTPGYLFSDMSYAAEYVDNFARATTIDPLPTLEKLIHLSAYRHAPIAIKPFFWSDTSFYNSDIFLANEYNAYSYNDTLYMPDFTESTATRSQSNFKFYHFNGSHPPYTMNADGSPSAEGSTAIDQTRGCFTHLFAAFERMKELGIYEDATIIITGDHGSAWDDTLPVQAATRIGLFYKPSGSAGTPLQLSAAPVCTDNISATIAKAAGLADYSAYGLALDDIAEDAQITRYYYKTQAIDGWERIVCKYAIEGYAWDFSNWHLIETVEDLPESYSFY